VPLDFQNFYSKTQVWPTATSSVICNVCSVRSLKNLYFLLSWLIT